MNAEYQRLDAQARDVEDQMRELPLIVDLRSAADLAKFERQMADLGRKLASLRLGRALIRATNSPEMRTREREFVRELPKRFHSQGTREKIVHLPGGVTVTLSVTYYHRSKLLEKTRQNGRRGLFPMLMLLGVSPEMTTAAYRMGDSSLVIMSPMNPYFILVLGFARRWAPGLGVGGLLSTLLPFAVAFFVAGLVVTGVWAALGLATGPAAPFHYLIPS